MGLRTVLAELAKSLKILVSPTTSTALICGHITAHYGMVSAFGVTIPTYLPKEDGTQIDYCHACLSRMAIRCGSCGNPIFTGQTIGLVPKKSDREAVEFSVTHRGNTGTEYFVSCHSKGCIEPDLTMLGFWIAGPDGKGVLNMTPIILSRLFKGDNVERLRKFLEEGETTADN